MSSIAIITARGGSKRIPQKNIRAFCGKPIIEYSIRSALDSEIFDEVMVSTDDADIAEIAVKCGAAVPFIRSQNNSDDYATTSDVLLEVLNEYQKSRKQFDYACCLYPTAPLITAQRLTTCMELLIESNADSLIPVVKFSFPPQRAFIIEQNKLKYKWTENASIRSQDLEPFYHDCGQFYMFKVEAFLTIKRLVTDHTIPYIMPETEAQDIDNLDDWKLAELKYKVMYGR